MTLAILCSGQGWQRAGMFALTADVPQAAALFAHASILLGGRDPRDIVQSETSEVLHHDRMGQVLCTLQALAAAAALKDALPGEVVVAGYSIGELAAWGVAGFLGVNDTLDLAAKRAEAMDVVALPGDGLSFVRGLWREAIDALCNRHDVAIAIAEPGDAFVLGGNRAALQALADEAKAMGATRIVALPVEVASHTRRLASASTAFYESLKSVRVTQAPAGTRLLSGIDGAPVLQIDAGLEKLATQISQTVMWADCLQGCIEAGATVFLELGPGSALAKMAAEAYSGVAARSLDDFRTLQGVRAWLAHNVTR